MRADVIVVGGGPAGLSAALHLARYDRSVLLLDSRGGRSSFRQVNRNYLGFPGGVAVTELVALGREQLAAYPQVTFVDAEVGAVSRTDGGFAVPQGTGRALVLATGVTDDYPHFEGWEQCVGASVFWCTTCDGWEARGKRVVVTGDDDAAALEALQLRHFTDTVTLVTNSGAPSLSDEVRARLERNGVRVVDDVVRGARHRSGQLQQLELSHQDLPVDMLFSAHVVRPQSGLAAALGVTCRPDGYVEVDLEQRTDVSLVVAAGDLTSLHSHAVTAAVHQGAQAAATLHHDLLPPDLQ